MKPVTRNILLALLVLLSAAGFWLTYVLADSHIIFFAGGVSQARFCGDVGFFDCHQVANHESSWLFGIPLPYWGLLYYIVVACLSVAALALRGPHQKVFLRVGAVVCGLAVLFDVYLGLVMVTQIGNICVKCVATYVVNVLLALTFWGLDRATPDPVHWLRLLPSWRALRPGDDEEYYTSLIKILLIGTTAAAAWLTWDKRLDDLHTVLAGAERQADRFITRIRSGEDPDVDMSVFEGQPSTGPDDAPVQVAVFGDFKCLYCRGIARKLEALRLETPDRVRVWFVNSPSEHACNPNLPEDRVATEGACWLARGAECAREQGRFWDYHHFLYEKVLSKDIGEDLVLERLPEIGLDPDRFRACLGGDSAKAALEADIELGARIGLTFAPAIVINGHQKTGNIIPSALERIVKTLLERPATADPSSGGA
jgi:protein-disulfide isomerase/uncharacterized membrane protein